MHFPSFCLLDLIGLPRCEGERNPDVAIPGGFSCVLRERQQMWNSTPSPAQSDSFPVQFPVFKTTINDSFTYHRCCINTRNFFPSSLRLALENPGLLARDKHPKKQPSAWKASPLTNKKAIKVNFTRTCIAFVPSFLFCLIICKHLQSSSFLLSYRMRTDRCGWKKKCEIKSIPGGGFVNGLKSWPWIYFEDFFLPLRKEFSSSTSFRYRGVRKFYLKMPEKILKTAGVNVIRLRWQFQKKKFV